MSRLSTMLCMRCGYDRRNVYIREPFAPCPECGDASCPGLLLPWPHKAQVVAHLIGLQVVFMFVTAAALFVALSIGAEFLILVAALVALLVICVIPLVQVNTLVARHCPENSRRRMVLWLLFLSWTAGVAMLVLMFAAVAALMAIGSGR